MEFFPALSLGWLNGWLLIVVFYTFYLVLLKSFPEETVQRLYENTGWTDRQARFARIGLPFALAGMILILFTPLRIGKLVFWVGLVLALVGQIGFVHSLHSFNITPLDQPVTTGLYKYSRNPQWVTFALVLVGFSLMVGSWTVLLLFGARIVLNHFRILGEERALENQYGQSYLEFKQSVPRYLIFF